jgi:lipoprotein-anchoring transpeptidase ErfK/SrfK
MGMNRLIDERWRVAFPRLAKGAVLPGFSGTVLVVCLIFLTGCANEREWPASPFFPAGNLAPSSGEYGDEISYWNGGQSGGKPKIVIDLEQQRAYFYRSGRVVGVSVVSTGREGYDTPSGEFRIIQKDLNHVSSIYGDYVDRDGQVIMENVDVQKDQRPRGTVFRGAAMPYFLRIHGGIGMHAGYLPGYPASHGCIRLPKEMAVHFFQNVTVGTPVVVRQETPQEHEPGPLIGDKYLPLGAIMER